MSRCELSGVGTAVKNKVSHSHIKTKSKALANIQKKQVFSTSLGERFRFKISTATLKSMEHMGGFDVYILRQKEDKLSRKALLVRNRIVRKLRTTKAAAAAPKKAV